MDNLNFVRVGASVLELKVADTIFNVSEIKKQIDKALESKIDILVFPELCISGYTCADLFHQDTLINETYKAVKDLLDYSINKDITFIVGSLIKLDNSLFNIAIVIINKIVKII